MTSNEPVFDSPVGWVKNHIQNYVESDGKKGHKGHARHATLEEKPRVWQNMASIFPTYNTYQTKAAKTGRELPVVIIKPMK